MPCWHVTAKSLKYLCVTLDRQLAFDMNAKLLADKAKRIPGTLHASIGKFAGEAKFQKIYIAKIGTAKIPTPSPLPSLASRRTGIS